MSRKRDILRNVGSSWVSLGITILVAIFLSPYVLHRLGDDAFGLWVLVVSLTGYYGMFDLGIRSSIIRYVAKYTATGDREELTRLVNTALFCYGGIGLVCFAITVVGAVYIHRLFNVPSGFLRDARLLFLMVGTSVALGFPLGVFGGILEGLQRFYLLNFTTIAYTLSRAALVVFALQHGKGLLTVGLITVGLPIVAWTINAIVVMRILPLRFGMHLVNRATLRRMASYSGVTFMLLVGGRLRLKTDALVIATFLSSAAITYFSIGSRLVDYATDIVSSLAQIFIPMSSETHATGDIAGLRSILIAGSRGCAMISFPLAAIYIILGKSLIEAWVGARYVATSYPILVVLIVPFTLILAQSAAERILFGIARHKTWAMVSLGEGVINLVLSIVLVRKFGIMGDALGTAIPMAITMLFFMPRHICRILGLRVSAYLREAFLLPLLLTIPLSLTLVLLRHWFIAHTYFQAGVQSLIGLAVYAVGVGWAIWTKRAWNLNFKETWASEETNLAIVQELQEEL
jgi:O-antigen/teichoic acid export membrane protein